MTELARVNGNVEWEREGYIVSFPKGKITEGVDLVTDSLAALKFGVNFFLN